MLSRFDGFCLCEDQYPHPHVVHLARGPSAREPLAVYWLLVGGCPADALWHCVTFVFVKMRFYWFCLSIWIGSWQWQWPHSGQKLSLFLDEVDSRGDWKCQCGVPIVFSQNLAFPSLLLLMGSIPTGNQNRLMTPGWSAPTPTYLLFLCVWNSFWRW